MSRFSLGFLGHARFGLLPAAALALVALGVTRAHADDAPRPAAAVEAGPPAPQTPPPAPEPTFDPSTLQPHFKDKALATIAQEVQAGRTRAVQALKKLPAKSPDPVILFLRAEALDETGDEAGAARLYEDVAGKYPAMSARCHCEAAFAFERLGDLTQAVKHYGPCSEDPVLGHSATIAQARLLAKLGKTEAALKALETAPASARVEMLAAKAQILSDAGHHRDALALYRQIYLEEPLSPFAERAQQHARELAAKLKASPPSSEQLAMRIEKLLTARKLHEAIAGARELPSKPLCTGAACAPRRCEAAAAPPVAEVTEPDEAQEESDTEPLPPELNSAKPPRIFSIAKAHDPENKEPAGDPELPKCAVKEPVKPADAGLCRAQFVRGWIAQKQRQHTKALELLRPVYERCLDPELRARALFLAQISADKLEDPDALDLALLAAYQFPSSSVADDALMAAANLAREQGSARTERAALRRLVRQYPDSKLRAEALFRLFWSHRMEGRPDRGLEYLDTLAKEYENGPHGDGADADRGHYWWGRTVAINAVKADRPKGFEVLGQLMHDRPLTYYGVLARAFVEAVRPAALVAPAMVEPYPGRLRLGALAQDRAFQEALEFWRMGDMSAVRDALGSVDYKALRSDGRRGSEAILILAELYQRMGDLRTAHSVARRDLLKVIRDANDPLGHRAALVCYPLAFRTPVTENATKNGFSPNFLQGLMREESALDPHARSPVGARGLTQLMPRTAKLVAKSIGLRRFRVDALWQPETNIEIGSVYLGRMLKHFGHPGLAAAAYNAGPNAVDRWLTGSTMAFDEFVEQIPFSETRGYVKRVLRSFAAYQYLYETSNPAIRISLGLRNVLPTPN